jgi:protein SCO1/2
VSARAARAAAPAPAETAFDAVAAFAEQAGGADALVGLLPEQSPIYDGLGNAEAERVRARIFAALAGGPLPEAAIPFLLEELETGMDAATSAAAATALARAPGEVPGAEAAMLKALRRLDAADRPLDLEPGIAGGARNGRTALQQAIAALADLPGGGEASRAALAGLLAGGQLAVPVREEAERTLARLESRRAQAPASCCSAAAAAPDVPAEAAGSRHVRMQDQAGKRLWLDEFLGVEPVVLAFFYTRCMNPERCSLTVTKLARLQPAMTGRGLAERVRIAAISYDPDYDRPQRLGDYGAQRGFRFDARNRFFRTTGPIAPVRALFDLGVGYGPSTVNRHRLELLLFDTDGAIARAFTRALWDEEEVAAALVGLAA